MLKISQADYNLIRWEAVRVYPRECCGIMLGKVIEGARDVTLTIVCRNISDQDQARRYRIDTQQIIAAQKLGRSRSEEIVGFYHSHPDHPSLFSPTDLAEAHWFDCSYVIASVEQGKVTATQSFVLLGNDDHKRLEPEEIEIHSPVVGL